MSSLILIGLYLSSSPKKDFKTDVCSIMGALFGQYLSRASWLNSPVCSWSSQSRWTARRRPAFRRGQRTTARTWTGSSSPWQQHLYKKFYLNDLTTGTWKATCVLFECLSASHRSRFELSWLSRYTLIFFTFGIWNQVRVMANCRMYDCRQNDFSNSAFNFFTRVTFVV